MNNGAKYRSLTRIYRKEMSSGGRSNFTGKVIDPEKTWNGDITLYVEPGLNTMEIKDIPFAQ